MSRSTDETIAAALLRHLDELIRSRPTARAFFRLEGFSPATYSQLVGALAAQNGRVGDRPTLLRSLHTLEGHPEVLLEAQRSATWYRNSVPEGHVLILILNRRATDDQSLKDLFLVSELSLTSDGLPALIGACFQGYQLDAAERDTLVQFVRRYRRIRYEPQLRDLAEFFAAVDATLVAQRDVALAQAVADGLPQLGLFRCRELAEQLNTARGDKLIQQLGEAARIGEEILEPKARNAYHERLGRARLADDSAFGGLSADDKRRLLARFVDGALAEQREELLRALAVDWNEVREVISPRARATKQQRYLKTAERLRAAAEQAGLATNEDLAEVVASLHDSREPDGEAVERLIAEGGDSLGRSLRNDLRRLTRPRSRRSADFLVGLAELAVDLLHTREGPLPAGAALRVAVAPSTLERKGRIGDAAAVFFAVYGGIAQALPSVQWQLEPLLAARELAAAPADEAADDERERITPEPLVFRVSVVGVEGWEPAAELIWQYRPDNPATATARALAAERSRVRGADLGPLFAADPPLLAIPIFNGCRPLDEIGDLDLRRPLQSLGPWYERPADLRAALEAQLKPRARPQAWAELDGALRALEQAWAAFVIAAADDGLCSADVGGLLAAYERLLATAQRALHTGVEVGTGYRLLNQAWMIGQQSFASWAIVPLLHPLKLLWWRERLRAFDRLIARLLDPAGPPQIVDVRRFRQDLVASYSSSGFPAVLALPPGEGRPAERLLPAEEAEGYELYFNERAGVESYGLDLELLAEDERELAARRSVEGIAAVIQDYVETYPFVRDGVEIFLFECRNGALPGLLIEQLTTIGQRRGWSLRITLVVHSSERGAPLFRRVSAWAAGADREAERRSREYFPPIAVQVLQCEPEALFARREDTDIVILADVLADRGQQVRSRLEPLAGEDLPVSGYLPTYRARQEPFQRGEQHRSILLTPPDQPAVSRLFLVAQHAASERHAPQPHSEARFYRELSLERWQHEIERLHQRFNWVICYDPTIDRFLLEAAFPEQVQVIRYSLGLGAKRQHNLTVSSSGRSQQIVTGRLAGRLGQLFPQAPGDVRSQIAEQLVAEAKLVSGDIVLRAAGPGAFLHELIGLVAAKFATEGQAPAAGLRTWILLDDFEHWFGGGKFPDLLFVQIGCGQGGELTLGLHILEAKCVGELSFAAEAADAQEQVRRGVARLARAFAPGAGHLDAPGWYDQLYRAVAGNLIVELEQQPLWELFRERLHDGNFVLDVSGHSWIFCYDGQASASDGPDEQPFAVAAPDAPEVPLTAHHYGRNELAALLGALAQARGGPALPAEVWLPPPPQPAPPAATPAPPAATPAPPAPPAPPADLPSMPAPTVPAVAADPPVPSAGLRPAPAAVPPVPSAPAASAADDIRIQARALERALRQRGVNVQPIDPQQADVGPSVVRFKVRLSGSETLKKIQSVATDLARDLALDKTPLIGNVLGTSFVGVDIPRERPEVIALRPLLDQLPPPAPAALPIVIGVSPDGALVSEDLSEFPHLLVAGVTNSGKSVFLRGLLLSLMTQYRPGELELLIVDPKQTDFTFFNRSPFLRGGKIFTQAEEARNALLELVRHEMPRRQELMAQRQQTKIKLYNQRYPEEALPPIVALIDEYTLLIGMMDKKQREAFEQDLNLLGAAARSVGIHLVIATQHPSAEIVTPKLKANLDARIAFRVTTNTNSRVVIDAPGAENLLGRGDLLFRRAGENARLQAPYMSEDDVQAYLTELLASHRSA